MEGVILCGISIAGLVLMLGIVAIANSLKDRKNKPVFGRLVINLQDPEADMFKLEIDINDPNILLQAKQVTLEVVEVRAIPTNSQKKPGI